MGRAKTPELEAERRRKLRKPNAANSHPSPLKGTKNPKLSRANRDRWASLTIEERRQIERNISKGTLGIPKPANSRKHTVEHRRNNSEAQVEHYVSMTPEERKRVYGTSRGRPSKFKGLQLPRKASEEVLRRAISLARDENYSLAMLTYELNLSEDILRFRLRELLGIAEYKKLFPSRMGHYWKDPKTGNVFLSLNEIKVGRWLDVRSIKYRTGGRIGDKEVGVLFYDFYLEGSGLYIEMCGQMEKETYRNRLEVKRGIYETLGLRYLFIYPETWEEELCRVIL